MEPKLYELSCLLKNEAEEILREVFEKARKYIEEKNGRTFEEPHLAKRRFSYPIKKESEGYFAYFKFFLKPEEMLGLREILGHEKNILRYLLVNAVHSESRPRLMVRKIRKPVEKKAVDLAEIDKKLEEILGN